MFSPHTERGRGFRRMVWKTPQIGGAILGTVLACGRRRRQPTVDSGPSVVLRVGPEVASRPRAFRRPMRGLDALARSSRIARRGLEPMRRCGVVSAIHGLRRVGLGRFVVCATTSRSCLAARVACAVGEDECGAGFDLHRGMVLHVPVQFSNQRVIDRNVRTLAGGLGRS